MIKRWLIRKELREIYAERNRLANIQQDWSAEAAWNPTVGQNHTIGMYAGLNYAIWVLEGGD